MGSAWPLFYHKLFYIVAGSFHAITSSVKISICLSLYLFGLIGVYGIYRICRDIELGYWKSVIVAISFPHLNYVVTDYLVRSAFAEYAALCLTTLLIWWCVHLVVKKVFSLSIAIILFAVFLSHSVIAYYGALAIVVSFVIFCTAYPKRLFEVTKKATLAGVIFFILAGPILLLMYLLGRNTNLDYLRIFYPTEEYIPFWRYIFDKGYTWGNNCVDTTGVPSTVQLDIFYLLGIIFLLVMFGIIVKKRAVDLKKTFWRTSARHGLCAITVILSIYLVLQLPVSALFYKYLPGADFIQFPWRLLTFVVILIVVLFAMLASVVNKFYPSISTGVIAVVSIASIALAVARPIHYGWFSEEAVEYPPRRDWREYWPTWSSADDKGVRSISGEELHKQIINKRDLLRKYSRMAPLAIDSPGSVIEEMKDDTYLQRSYLIRSRKSSVIILPLIYSGIETVLVYRDPKWYRVNHYRTEDDFRVQFSVPGGMNRVKVLLPTIFRVMMKLKYPHLRNVESEAVEKDSRQ